MRSKFKAYTNYKVFLVSPSIMYHMEGETTQYIYKLPSGIVGVPDAATFDEIYERYF